MIVWFIALTVIGIFCCLWAYFHRPTWVSVFVWPLLYLFIFTAGAEIVGKPKPVNLEWRPVEEVQVLAWRAKENEVIWLWIFRDDGPVNYVMPWSKDQAKELHEAEKEAEEKGGQVIARIWGDNSLEDRRAMFYARPQPPLPPKR